MCLSPKARSSRAGDWNGNSSAPRQTHVLIQTSKTSWFGSFRCYNCRSSREIKHKDAEMLGKAFMLEKHYEKWSSWSAAWVWVFLLEYLPLTLSQVPNYCPFYVLSLGDSENTLQTNPFWCPSAIIPVIRHLPVLSVCRGSRRQSRCFQSIPSPCSCYCTSLGCSTGAVQHPLEELLSPGAALGSSSAQIDLVLKAAGAHRLQ